MGGRVSLVISILSCVLVLFLQPQCSEGFSSFQPVLTSRHASKSKLLMVKRDEVSLTAVNKTIGQRHYIPFPGAVASHWCLLYHCLTVLLTGSESISMVQSRSAPYGRAFIPTALVQASEKQSNRYKVMKIRAEELLKKAIEINHVQSSLCLFLFCCYDAPFSSGKCTRVFRLLRLISKLRTRAHFTIKSRLFTCTWWKRCRSHEAFLVGCSRSAMSTRSVKWCHHWSQRHTPLPFCCAQGTEAHGDFLHQSSFLCKWTWFWLVMSTIPRFVLLEVHQNLSWLCLIVHCAFHLTDLHGCIMSRETWPLLPRWQVRTRELCLASSRWTESQKDDWRK